MKKIIIPIILVLITFVAYYFYTQTKEETIVSESIISKTSPDRPAEISGIITSILGNEIKIAKEINRVILSEAEQAAKKVKMQSLSPEEKAAVRESEKENLETEEISLIIPVGTPLVKGSGEANGEMISADIADLSKGTYVSIWTDGSENIEYIKIKGI
jgi:hypothetical protein